MGWIYVARRCECERQQTVGISCVLHVSDLALLWFHLVWRWTSSPQLQVSGYFFLLTIVILLVSKTPKPEIRSFVNVSQRRVDRHEGPIRSSLILLIVFLPSSSFSLFYLWSLALRRLLLPLSVVCAPLVTPLQSSSQGALSSLSPHMVQSSPLEALLHLNVRSDGAATPTCHISAAPTKSFYGPEFEPHVWHKLKTSLLFFSHQSIMSAKEELLAAEPTQTVWLAAT